MELRVEKLFKKIDGESFFVALFLSFTVCFFGPVEIYYTNSDDIFFEISKIIGIFALIELFAFLFLYLILILSKRIDKRKYFISFIWGISICIYLQGNFINAQYGPLNGTPIVWESFKTYGLINSLCWMFILILSLIVSIVCKNGFDIKLRKYVSIFIIGIELITLAVLCISHQMDNRNSEKIVVSDYEQFTVGEDGNIILFLLDTYDASVFNEVLQSEFGNEIKSEFSDFTYYDNVTGGFPYTTFSVPLILTGKWYDKSEEYYEYINCAYKETKLYDELIRQDYKIGLYGDYSMISSSMYDYVYNIFQGNSEITSLSGIVDVFYNLTAFKYLPHALKKYADYINSNFNAFYSSESYQFMQDIAFYEKLIDENISTKKNERRFIFYHLNGIHSPYFLNENIVEDSSATEEEQAKGELRIVEAFIHQLKEKKCYDNSTIVVLADHGYKGMGQNPLLMVKEASKSQKFKINSSPISYDDLQGTFLYWISGDAGGLSTIYDFDETEQRKRLYRYHTLTEQTDVNLPLIEYEINGQAKDIGAMRKTGNLYSIDGINQQEKLKYSDGLVVTFSNEGNYSQCINAGYRNFNGSIYSFGDETTFLFDMSEYVSENIQLCVTFANVLNAVQNVEVYVNDNYIGSQEVTLDNMVANYSISADYLNDKTMSISFRFPNALSDDGGMVVEGHTGEGMAVVFYQLNFDKEN